MGDAARRSRGQRAGPAIAALTGLVVVAGLAAALTTCRHNVPANPNSAILASAPPPTWPAPSGATDAPWPKPPADPSVAVDTAVADAAAKGVDIGVVVVDRSTGAALVERDADVPYPSLSLLKVMIAADVLTHGWPAGDDTLGEQDGLALQADPGGRAGIAAVDAAVRAALGGPAG